MEILRLILISDSLIQRLQTLGVFVLGCLALSLHTGCEKLIDLEVNQEPEQWVLYGTLRPGETLSVELYRSLPAIGVISDSFWVSNASVWLFAEGEDSLLMEEVDKGIYESATPVEAGKSYALKAYHPSLPVLATQYLFLPPPPEVTFSLVDSVSKSSSNRYKSLLTVTFPDTLSSEIIFINARVEVDQELFRIYHDLFATSPISATCSSSGRVDYIDLACSGASTFLLDLPEYDDSFGSTVPIDAFVLEFGLSSSSELDFFKAFFREEGFELGLSDPALIPSSIQNGYGYWSIASGRQYRIER